MVNFGIFNYDGVTGLRNPVPCGFPCDKQVRRVILSSLNPTGGSGVPLLNWSSVLHLFMNADFDAMVNLDGSRANINGGIVPWDHAWLYQMNSGTWLDLGPRSAGDSPQDGIINYQSESVTDPTIGYCNFTRTEYVFPPMFGNWCASCGAIQEGFPPFTPNLCSGPGPDNCIDAHGEALYDSLHVFYGAFYRQVSATPYVNFQSVTYTTQITFAATGNPCSGIPGTYKGQCNDSGLTPCAGT